MVRVKDGEDLCEESGGNIRKKAGRFSPREGNQKDVEVELDEGRKSSERLEMMVIHSRLPILPRLCAASREGSDRYRLL